MKQIMTTWKKFSKIWECVDLCIDNWVGGFKRLQMLVLAIFFSIILSEVICLFAVSQTANSSGSVWQRVWQTLLFCVVIAPLVTTINYAMERFTYNFCSDMSEWDD